MKLTTLTRIVIAVIVTAGTLTLVLAWMVQESENKSSNQWRRQSVLRRRMDNNHILPSKFRIRQHGKYWILYNYITPMGLNGVNDSITLTTHGDYTYLNLLGPLLRSWRSHISMTIFASGSDFDIALKSIRYLHDCMTPTGFMIDLLVTFNFVIHEDHLPAYIPKSHEEIFGARFNCLDAAPFHSDSPSYRHLHALEYPINLLRNVARESAHTYYVFPLHMELFPTPNFVVDFLHMVKKVKLKHPRRTVFCLPVFEVRHGVFMPATKSELKATLRDNSVTLFHAFDAAKNEVPNQNSWLMAIDPGGMEVFQITKRIGKWDPWCVTINEVEPLYDERYSLNSMYDKIAQTDLLEALNYDFAVLDGAFIVQYTSVKLFQQYNYDHTKTPTEMPKKSRTSYQDQMLRLYYDKKSQLIEDNYTT